LVPNVRWELHAVTPLAWKRLNAKRLDVKPGGRFRVGESFFIGTPLTHDSALPAERIGHETVGVLLDDELELGHGYSSPFFYLQF
jgi:L-ascorbate metabolism protein UlaG (beta-lactamase superfamily)